MVKKIMQATVVFVFIALCAYSGVEFDSNNDGIFDPQFKVNQDNFVDGSAIEEIRDDDGPGSGLDADTLDGYQSTAFELADPTILKQNDVDDVPVDGATQAPVSSNRMHDHENSTAAHGLAFDPETGQLLAGSVPMVFSALDWKNTYIDNFDEHVDGYEIFRTPVFPVTITHIGINCEGACSTPGVFSFSDASGNALTVGAMTVATGSNIVNCAAVSVGGGLLAGEGLKVTTTNTPTAGDKYGFHIVYKVDVQ